MAASIAIGTFEAVVTGHCEEPQTLTSEPEYALKRRQSWRKSNQAAKPE
jgi:hypothetical protein